MIATLHHHDVERALLRIRDLLRPGGKFLCAGLAPPVWSIDHLCDAASMATNPFSGYVRHPWVNHAATQPDPFPSPVPERSVDELRTIATDVLPGAGLTRHLGFRHTIEWTATP